MPRQLQCIVCGEYPGCHLDDIMLLPVPFESLVLAPFLYFLVGDVPFAL